MNVTSAAPVVSAQEGGRPGVAAGAPVNLNGIPLGKIKRITLSDSKTPDPNRVVRIDMEIPLGKLSAIPVDSVASISAANLLGSKFINIKRGQSTTTVRPGAEIPAENTGEFEDLVKQGFATLSSMKKTIERLDNIVAFVENGQGSVGRLLRDETLYNNLLTIVNTVQQLANALNSDKGTLGKLIYDPELYNNVKGTLARVDGMVQGLERGEGTAGKLLKDPVLYNDLQKTSENFRKLTDDLNAGKGTAGKLLKNEDLHRQLQATIERIDVMLDKLNAGQGTLGQLLVNPQMYDNLNGATREMNLLMKDFRANPKKFLRIKLAIF